MVCPRPIALVAPVIAAVEDMQLSSAMTPPEKARKQKLATPDRALDGTDAHPVGVVGDHALIPLKLVLAYVTFVTFPEKNVPFLRRASQSAPDSLAARLHADPAASAAERVGASINRVGQNIMDSVVGGRAPGNPLSFWIPGLHWKLDSFFDQPDQDLAGAGELGKLGKHQRQRLLHTLVWIFLDPVLADLHITGGDPQKKLAAARLLLERLMRALPEHGKLKFAHRAFDAQQQSVVRQAGIVRAHILMHLFDRQMVDRNR